MGRTSFDQTEGEGGWGDGGPVGDTPCFVVTHDRPSSSYPSVFTFVTDGVASTIEQARVVAGDKVVGQHSTTVMQQALPLGLVDEIRVHVVPVLLGGGSRCSARSTPASRSNAPACWSPRPQPPSASGWCADTRQAARGRRRRRHHGRRRARRGSWT
jgi:hypothetical protein